MAEETRSQITQMGVLDEILGRTHMESPLASATKESKSNSIKGAGDVTSDIIDSHRGFLKGVNSLIDAASTGGKLLTSDLRNLHQGIAGHLDAISNARVALGKRIESLNVSMGGGVRGQDPNDRVRLKEFDQLRSGFQSLSNYERGGRNITNELEKAIRSGNQAAVREQIAAMRDLVATGIGTKALNDIVGGQSGGRRVPGIGEGRDNFNGQGASGRGGLPTPDTHRWTRVLQNTVDNVLSSGMYPIIEKFVMQPMQTGMQGASTVSSAVPGMTLLDKPFQTMSGYLSKMGGDIQELETERKALKSVTGSDQAASKMMEHAINIARAEPVEFGAALSTFRTFSVFPGTREEVKSSPGFREELLDVIQRLAILTPEQGTEGATFALRELLSGQERSLQRRFNVDMPTLMQAAGRPDLDKSKFLALPGTEMISILDKAMKNITGSSALVEKSLTTTVQTNDIGDTLRQVFALPFNKTGLGGSIMSKDQREDLIENVLIPRNQKMLGPNVSEEEIRARAIKEADIASSSPVGAMASALRGFNQLLGKTMDSSGIGQSVMKSVERNVTLPMLGAVNNSSGNDLQDFLNVIRTVTRGIAKTTDDLVGNSSLSAIASELTRAAVQTIVKVAAPAAGTGLMTGVSETVNVGLDPNTVKNMFLGTFSSGLSTAGTGSMGATTALGIYAGMMGIGGFSRGYGQNPITYDRDSGQFSTRIRTADPVNPGFFKNIQTPIDPLSGGKGQLLRSMAGQWHKEINLPMMAFGGGLMSAGMGGLTKGEGFGNMLTSAAEVAVGFSLLKNAIPENVTAIQKEAKARIAQSRIMETPSGFSWEGRTMPRGITAENAAATSWGHQQIRDYRYKELRNSMLGPEPARLSAENPLEYRNRIQRAANLADAEVASQNKAHSEARSKFGRTAMMPDLALGAIGAGFFAYSAFGQWKDDQKNRDEMSRRLKGSGVSIDVQNSINDELVKGQNMKVAGNSLIGLGMLVGQYGLGSMATGIGGVPGGAVALTGGAMMAAGAAMNYFGGRADTKAVDKLSVAESEMTYNNLMDNINQVKTDVYREGPIAQLAQSLGKPLTETNTQGFGQTLEDEKSKIKLLQGGGYSLFDGTKKNGWMEGAGDAYFKISSKYTSQNPELDTQSKRRIKALDTYNSGMSQLLGSKESAEFRRYADKNDIDQDGIKNLVEMWRNDRSGYNLESEIMSKKAIGQGIGLSKESIDKVMRSMSDLDKEFVSFSDDTGDVKDRLNSVTEAFIQGSTDLEKVRIAQMGHMLPEILGAGSWKLLGKENKYGSWFSPYSSDEDIATKKKGLEINVDSFMNDGAGLYTQLKNVAQKITERETERHQTLKGYSTFLNSNFQENGRFKADWELSGESRFKRESLESQAKLGYVGAQEMLDMTKLEEERISKMKDPRERFEAIKEAQAAGMPIDYKTLKKGHEDMKESSIYKAAKDGANMTDEEHLDKLKSNIYSDSLKNRGLFSEGRFGFKVTGVKDPDTVMVDQPGVGPTEMRIKGIDAPEMPSDIKEASLKSGNAGILELLPQYLDKLGFIDQDKIDLNSKEFKDAKDLNLYNKNNIPPAVLEEMIKGMDPSTLDEEQTKIRSQLLGTSETMRLNDKLSNGGLEYIIQGDVTTDRYGRAVATPGSKTALVDSDTGENLIPDMLTRQTVNGYDMVDNKAITYNNLPAGIQSGAAMRGKSSTNAVWTNEERDNFIKDQYLTSSEIRALPPAADTGPWADLYYRNKTESIKKELGSKIGDPNMLPTAASSISEMQKNGTILDDLLNLPTNESQMPKAGDQSNSQNIIEASAIDQGFKFYAARPGGPLDPKASIGQSFDGAGGKFNIGNNGEITFQENKKLMASTDSTNQGPEKIDTQSSTDKATTSVNQFGEEVGNTVNKLTTLNDAIESVTAVVNKIPGTLRPQQLA